MRKLPSRCSAMPFGTSAERPSSRWLPSGSSTITPPRLSEVKSRPLAVARTHSQRCRSLP